MIYQFGPTPPSPNGSIELEESTLESQADSLVGLDVENPLSKVRRQFLVDKYLEHCAHVLKMCFKCFQRFGPDSVFFKVTGAPDAMTFSKGNPNENYDVIITYDVLNNDPEVQEKKLQQIVNLTGLDR